MLIDWFTVGAQVLNFAILVVLMRRFLYQPVLNAIDAREKKIATAIADAAAKQSEALAEREELAKKNEEISGQRAALLSEAAEEAAGERRRLLGEARDAADAVAAKWRRTLHADALSVSEAIRSRAQQEVFAIARKAFADLADAPVQERMVAVLIRRLRELDGEAKEGFAAALKGASTPPLVRCALGLTAAQRSAIEGALGEVSSLDAGLRFEVAPELISGIEIIANGQKLSWSVAEYLGALERRVGDVLAREMQLSAAQTKRELLPAEAGP